MGCCASRNASRPSSPRHASATATSRASTPNSPANTAVQVTNSSSRVNVSGSNAFRRPNASLRQPKAWRSTSRTWTKQQLVREREIFWETQVTGHQEVWAALRLAVDMINGATDQQEADLKGAKAVLDAVGCTCPTGRLGEGVWDEQGRLYKLPRWVVSDPINVVEGPAVEDDDEDVGEDDEVEEEDEEAKEGVHELYGEMDKGKDRAPAGSNANIVTITTRLSDRGSDLKIVVDKDQPVKTLAKRVQAEANISSDVKLKMAYMGRIMKDNESPIAQGWKPGHVMNALVFQ